ncbi:MAG: hypothetical protein LBV43_15695 [Prevotella sp.]|jgi:hypothetical protein|nr:hypothetical protein [Prevotella sp.]
MKIKVFLLILIGLLFSALGAKAQFMLAEGTQITLGDDSKKSVEKLASGDILLVFNYNDKVYEEKKVTNVKKVMMNRLIRVTLETGMQITMSMDCPMWAERGWVAVDAYMARQNPKYATAKDCQLGEFILFYNITSTDYVEVSVIQGIAIPTNTYELELDGDGAIIANGFLIGQN